MRALYENKIDAKIRNLMPSEIELVQKGYLDLHKELWHPGKKVLHFRYLRIGFGPFAVLRYVALLLAAIVSRTPVIWFMHNYDEHKAKSHLANKIIRRALWRVSARIFVFHPSILDYVPRRYHGKSRVLNFGPIANEIFQQSHADEAAFLEQYKAWSGYRNIDLLVVSTARKTSYPSYVRHLGKTMNVLVINALATEDYDEDRVFLYKGYVYGQLRDVIEKNTRPMIALVFHENISVPTSIYSFAELGIPIITNDRIPNNAIVSSNGIGRAVSSNQDCMQAITDILADYQNYRDRCANFMTRQDWAVSQSALRTAINEITHRG